jgi:hypothetical protein
LLDFGNLLDLLFLFSSAAAPIHHLVTDPFNNTSRFLMIISILLSITRTFKLMRIFKDFSPIVTMLSNVVYDLRIFMIFYMILSALFSILLGIIGIGNMKLNEEFKEAFAGQDSYLGEEFKYLGLMIQNFMETLKISTGDFGLIDSSVYLESEENILFWVSWLIIVVVSCIIFLNFIIAEASASYEKVAADLDSFI